MPEPGQEWDPRELYGAKKPDISGTISKTPEKPVDKSKPGWYIPPEYITNPKTGEKIKVPLIANAGSVIDQETGKPLIAPSSITDPSTGVQLDIPTSTPGSFPTDQQVLERAQATNNFQTPGQPEPGQTPTPVFQQPIGEEWDPRKMTFGGPATPQQKVLTKAGAQPFTPQATMGQNILGGLKEIMTGTPQIGLGALKGGAQAVSLENLFKILDNPKQALQDISDRMASLREEAEAEPKSASGAIKYLESYVPILGPMTNAFSKALDKGDYEGMGNIIGQVLGAKYSPEIATDVFVKGGAAAAGKFVTGVRAAKAKQLEIMEKAKAAQAEGFQLSEGLRRPDIRQEAIMAGQKARATTAASKADLNAVSNALDRTVEKAPTEDHRAVEYDNPNAGGPEPDLEDPAHAQWEKDQEPIIKYDPIPSPIHTELTQSYALDKIDKLSKMIPNAPIASAGIRKILVDLKSMTRDAPSLDSVGNPNSPPRVAIEFPRMQALSEAIGDYLAKTKDINTPRARILEELKQRVDLDIDDSIRNNWQSDAHDTFTRYKDIKQAHADLMNPPLTRKLADIGITTKAQWETAIREAIKTQTGAENYKRATGDQQSLTHAIMKDLADRHTTWVDPKNPEYFDAGAAYNEITKNDGLWKEAVPPQVLDNFKTYLKNIADIQDKPYNYPGNLIKVNPWKYASLPGSLLWDLFHGHLSPWAGMGASYSTILFFASKFDKIMSDPVSARAWINMSKDPTSMPKVRKAATTALWALRGTAAVNILNPQTNEERPATVDKNGKLIVH